MAVQEDGSVAADAPTGFRATRLYVWIKTLRVYQWSKNVLLLAALIFAQEFTHPEKVVTALLAMAAFCLAASATYIFNDLMDIEKDRLHPKKKHRPLASGRMRVEDAVIIGILILVAGCGLAWSIRPAFFGALIAYMVLTLSYTLLLKHIIIVDVLALALGFVVRAVAGAIAIDVEFSNWLIVCTLFLATFMALSKRRHEMTLLEDGAHSHRAVLNHYSVNYLDQLILITAGAAILTYTIYTCSPEVVERLHTDKLYATLPFVVYGIFRYLFIVHEKTGAGDPSRILIKDWPMGLCVLLWGLSCMGLIYFGV